MRLLVWTGVRISPAPRSNTNPAILAGFFIPIWWAKLAWANQLGIKDPLAEGKMGLYLQDWNHWRSPEPSEGTLQDFFFNRNLIYWKKMRDQVWYTLHLNHWRSPEPSEGTLQGFLFSRNLIYWEKNVGSGLIFAAPKLPEITGAKRRYYPDILNPVS